MNFRAAVLEVKLKYLDGWTEARQRNAAFYNAAFAAAGLGERLVTPTAMPGQRHIFNQYIVRAARRDALKAWLAQCNIGTEIYYPVPLHLQECFAYLGHEVGDFSGVGAGRRRDLGAARLSGIERTAIDPRGVERQGILQVFLKSSGRSWCRDNSL